MGPARRPRARPRLAVLSHSAVEPTHAAKWERIADAGWDVLLLVPRRWPEAGRWQAGRPGRRGRLTVATLDGLFAGRVARWTPRGLAAVLDAFAPDLVHAEEEPYGIACWLAARWARAARVPFTFFTWENQLRRYSWPQRRILAAVLGTAVGALAGNADAVGVLRRRGFRRPVTIVPQYGVDPRMFRPLPRARCRRALGLPTAGRLVGFVGRFLPEKGIPDLLCAVRPLPAATRVLLLGDGPERGRLVALGGTLGLGDRLLLRPPVPRTRIPVVLGALDVLVLPSRTRPEWQEQFGRVLAEALCCGRWAVGSSSGEIPRVLGNRRLVYPEGRVSALTERLQALLGRPVPGSLRRRAVARFSAAAIATVTAQFLRTMVTGYNRGGTKR